MLQEARAHHRRQRQADKGRDQDRGGDRHGEFAEQPTDDAAHEQQRDEHRDQREADRDDGEADFAGALDGRLHRFHAVLDVAEDVLQHHDRIVDDEADGQGQRHQRQVVQAVVQQVHHAERADQRDRHGDTGDDGGPDVPKEQEDHHHDQADGQHQRELHIGDRGADGQRTVHDGADVDRGRDRGFQSRQRLLDPFHRVDDVGARLLEDDQQDAALAVLPAGEQPVLRGIDGTADIASPGRPRHCDTAKHDVFVFATRASAGRCRRRCRLSAAPSMLPFGALTVALTSRIAHILQGQAHGGELVGLDLAPARRAFAGRRSTPGRRRTICEICCDSTLSA